MYKLIHFYKYIHTYKTTSLLSYTVHGILQARILKCVAFPSPGDLPDPGIEQRSPAMQADSLPTELSGKPRD